MTEPVAEQGLAGRLLGSVQAAGGICIDGRTGLPTSARTVWVGPPLFCQPEPGSRIDVAGLCYDGIPVGAVG